MDDLIIKKLNYFENAREALRPCDQIANVCEGAKKLREFMLDKPKVKYYRVFNLTKLPYPAKYAFWNAHHSLFPFVQLINRMIVVQFSTQEGIKTLLVGPTDVEAAADTPYFARLTKIFGSLVRPGKLLSPMISSVEQCLNSINISPDAIDYITFDHLHTQDLRRWLGTDMQPAFFPNAKLLITRKEWESAQGLIPPQKDWYHPCGLKNINTEKVVLFDDDLLLGESVALIQTPGHTAGNHSIVIHTDSGLMVTSENGVSVESYAPSHSNISAIRKYAQALNAEAVLNGNTLEGSVQQYISMIQEKEIAGPSVQNADFPNIIPSSTLSWSWFNPGISPTFQITELEFGEPSTVL